jgi:glycosyltransferase involved in cell wall biosynthesis
MNIVILNHYAGGPQFGMEFRPYYLAREWKKKGHKVVIVGASFSHLRSIQPKVSNPITPENVEGMDYLWIKTNRYVGNGIGRIISMVLFSYKLFSGLRKVLLNFKPDLLIASSTYPLDNIPVCFLAKRLKAAYCYEVHDLWPLSPMELGGYSRFHPFIVVMQWAENFAYRNANYVISMLPKTLEHMVKHGLKKEKFAYVPNGISLDEWNDQQAPDDHVKYIERLRSNKEIIIVGYVGGHAVSNAMEYLIEAALLAQDKAPNLKFVLVGNGSEKNRLIELAKTRRLENVFFLEPIPKRQLPILLKSMDVLYLGWRHNPVYQFGISPNKLMDYMMAAKPIVHSVKAGNDYVHEASCGISVQPESPEAIVDALIKISKMDEHQRNEMGNKGKEFVTQRFSYEKLADDFITFVTSTTI